MSVVRPADTTSLHDAYLASLDPREENPSFAEDQYLMPRFEALFIVIHNKPLIKPGKYIMYMYRNPCSNKQVVGELRRRDAHMMSL